MIEQNSPPPRDDEAERAVLGALLLDAPAFQRAALILRPEMFFAERHGLLFGAIADLASRSVTADPITIRDELGRRGNLDRAGGMEYIASLIDVVPTAANVEYHAQIVAEKARRRQIAAEMHRLHQAAHNGIPLESIERDLAAAVASARAPRAGGAKQWRTLRDLLSEPEANSTPIAVIPRCAFRGRVTLFAAREKDGKSTFAAAGVAALTQSRPFLGEPVDRGTVLWIAAEEHPHDLAQRARDFGTDVDRLLVMACPPPESLFADIRAAVETLKPTLVVVDTLATAVGGIVDDPHSSTAWTPVMVAFTALARDFSVAILLLAHARKSDGAYRDSTAIGAGVDVILEMSTPVDDMASRIIKARGRWAMKPFTVRYTGHGFDLAGGGEISLDARVLLHIERHPGIGSREVRDEVGARGADVDAAIRGLELRGAVVTVPGPNRKRCLYAAKDAPLTVPLESSPDTPRDTPASASGECVPALSGNELAPDTASGVSHSQTLGDEPGHTEGDAWEPES